MTSVAGLGVLLIFSAAFGQQATRLKLTAGDAIVTPQDSVPTRIPLKCDTEGNIYMRGYQLPHPMGAPAVKITADGKKSIAARLDAEKFKDGDVMDSATDPAGTLYEAVSTAKGTFIVRFNSAGDYVSDRQLSDAKMVVMNMGAFPDGRIFLSGVLAEDGKAGSSLVNEIVDSSGQVIKKLTLKNDMDPKENDPQSDTPKVQFGSAIVAQDGNLYLFRRTNQAIVYVLTASGNVLRRMPIDPPEVGFQPLTFSVSGGRIAVQFFLQQGEKPDRDVFRVVDAETGALIADYDSPPDTGNAFACFSGNTFYYLKGQNGKLAIIKATPQ